MKTVLRVISIIAVSPLFLTLGLVALFACMVHLAATGKYLWEEE